MAVKVLPLLISLLPILLSPRASLPYIVLAYEFRSQFLSWPLREIKEAATATAQRAKNMKSDSDA
jgi:hypothetical protein